MIYYRLLLCIMIIISFLMLADVLPSWFPEMASLGLEADFVGDPLNPSLLGESMSMPSHLPQELIQEAKKAGVIRDSNPLYKPESELPGISEGSQLETDADNSLEYVNATGTWSFDLKGKVPEKMELHLIQNKDVIMGRGAISIGNQTEKATASGSILGEKMSLSVMPMGVSKLYKLNLSLSTLDSGTYIIYLADGSSLSGKVTFAVSSNIFKHPSAF